MTASAFPLDSSAQIHLREEYISALHYSLYRPAKQDARAVLEREGLSIAHRAREAGWSLEEVAYYLGHVTKKGTPAIQTTVRYTQVSREQVKEKLKQLRG